MVTVVVARELIITGLRSYLETPGRNFGADWLGKIKMGLQCAALIAIFVVLLMPRLAPADASPCWTGCAIGLIYAMLLGHAAERAAIPLAGRRLFKTTPSERDTEHAA